MFHILLNSRESTLGAVEGTEQMWWPYDTLEVESLNKFHCHYITGRDQMAVIIFQMDSRHGQLENRWKSFKE